MEADAVLEELTKEANLAKPTMRYALAVFVVYQGEASLHRVMARAAGKISVDEFQATIRLVQASRTWR